MGKEKEEEEERGGGKRAGKAGDVCRDTREGQCRRRFRGLDEGRNGGQYQWASRTA